MNRVFGSSRVVCALVLVLCVCSISLFAKDPLKLKSSAAPDVKEIPWQQDKRLTWDDFKGAIPADAGENTAAVTYCGIGFETNQVTETNKAKVFVYNTFYANQSWVRDGERSPDILAHEQGHFDICEIYTRKLRERVAAANITVYNLKAILQQIYNEVNNEYEGRQQAYERETQHGTITAVQQRWLTVIAQELDGTGSVALF